MEQTSNKDLVRRYIDEIWSRGNLDFVDEAMAEDYKAHIVVPGLPPTRAGYKQWARMVRDAMPDCRSEVNDMTAEGDKVVTRWTVTGTYSGSIMGIPATGQRVSVMGVTISRIQGSRVAEEWTTIDPSLALEQLGALAQVGHA